MRVGGLSRYQAGGRGEKSRLRECGATSVSMGGTESSVGTRSLVDSIDGSLMVQFSPLAGYAGRVFLPYRLNGL